MIKLEDLVIGEVYYQQYDKDLYICRFGGEGGDTFIQFEGGELTITSYDSGGITDENFITLRKATYEEICWLEACEKAECFIPKKDIKYKKLTKKAIKNINDLINSFDEI